MLVSFIISSFMAGCSLFPKEEEVLAPPLVKPADVKYNIYVVKRRDILNKISGMGTLIYATSSLINVEFSGSRLKEIDVKDGDKVVKGQTLGQLMNDDILQNISQTENELKTAQLKMQLNDLEMQDTLEKASYMGPEEEKYLLGKQIEQLDIDNVQDRLNRLKSQYESTFLKSPINGVVTMITSKKKGDIIDSFETLMQVSDPAKLIIDWQLSDTSKVMSIHDGTIVDVTYNDIVYKGTVVATPADFVLEKDRQNFAQTVRVNVEGLPDDAIEGKSVTLSYTYEKSLNTIVVPASSVIMELGKQFVYVLDGSSKRELLVETGISNPAEVEITNGLKEGDQVIIN